TALRLPAALVSFVGPLLTLPYSRSLVPAVAAIALGRVLMLVAHLVIGVRRYPYLRESRPSMYASMPPLLRFGAWMTLCNVIGPLMVYLDRFVIGGGLNLAAVTAYVTPYEVIARFLIVPAAITGAVMPALASTVTTLPARMAELHEKSL